MADSSDLLDAEGVGFGGSVVGATRGVERRDFVSSGVDGACEAGEFGALGVSGAL